MSAAQILVPLLGLFVFLVFSGVADGRSHKKGVTYDGRSLIINGKRELLFSGSVHYPRMPPEMWWDIINKAKGGGLHVIQTYVFWSLHEPVEGQYNFEGNCNLTKFIKTIGDNGIGLPFWLRDIPNITFRSDNLPFKYHMKKFTKKIIQMMKDEKLFASQGGPIILSQVRLKMNTLKLKLHGLILCHSGNSSMLENLIEKITIMVMSRSIRAMGETLEILFLAPVNQTSLFYGQRIGLLSLEYMGTLHLTGELKISHTQIARFFSKNGTLANYYMYYGGTNFGRSGSSFVTARYYDEAPIDEYGLLREPKWGHLRDLHSALKKCEKALLWGTPSVENLGEYMEAYIYEDIKSKTCAAFLSNNNSRIPAIIVAQHSSRNYQKSEIGNKDLNWEMSHEHIPTLDNSSIKSVNPLEHWSVTEETTDYLCLMIHRIELDRVALPFRKNLLPVIQISSLGHLLHAFVNGEYIGSGHGTNIKKSFVFEKPIILKPGTNHISLLGATVGLPDHGIYLARRYAGVRIVAIEGLNIGTIDVSDNGWGNKIGLGGEKLEVFTHSGSHREMNLLQLTQQPCLKAWCGSMVKASVVTWVSYLTPLGKPSQEVYHIPRAFLNPADNLLVIFEEIEGYIDGVQILTVNRNTICSYITENYLDNVHTAADDAKRSATLSCPDSKPILDVEFASYGSPFGTCGNYFLGNCSLPVSRKFVEKQCLGKSRCDVPFDKKIFDRDGDLCPNIPKYLAIQAVCGEK
ncbi:hypothetical protein Pint_28493 [Pistacia integerrima]|uniref:Uncharacterized protein n=1 Tax=Pistacia integerrima TaxID=434235 RepID=A0ACC0YPN0_9ROSI|nr:hypothetical protein Pint_28493 [Pistacia integerrima]